MKSCKDFREEGREILGNTLFQRKWLFPLLACLSISAAAAISSEFFFLGVIISGSLSVGISSYFLLILRTPNSEKSFKTLLVGFTSRLGRNIAAGLYYAVISAIYTVLIVLCIFASVYLIFPVFILPLPIYGLVRFTLKYSMLFFVLSDNPDYNMWQALSESAMLMKGYKWKYFKLQLSFIGWVFVSFITFGVGALWLNPYIYATNTVFYEQLKQENEYYVI